MLSSIFSSIKALAGIIQSVRAIIEFVKANKEEQWFQDSAKVFGELQKADTDDKRKQLAKDLRKLIGNM